MTTKLQVTQTVSTIGRPHPFHRIIKGLAPGEVWDEFLQLALRLARRP